MLKPDDSGRLPGYYPGKEDPHTNPKRKQGPPRLRFGLVLINFLAGVIRYAARARGISRGGWTVGR